MCDEQVQGLQTTLHRFATGVPILLLQGVEDINPTVVESMQNINTIKVENDTDVGLEEHPVCMHNVVYVPSTFSMSETEPEHNIDRIKVENDMGMVTEEDPVCMRSNDVYIPSAYCERESEPEQNVDRIKVENETAMVSEEDPRCVDSNDADIPSALSVQETVPEKKIDGIKAENDTDIDIEEGSICIKTDDVGILSSVSKKESGPECALKDHQLIRGTEDLCMPDTGSNSLSNKRVRKKRTHLHSGKHAYVCQLCDKTFSRKG